LSGPESFLTGELKDDLTSLRMEFDFQKVNERSNNLFLILRKKENFKKSEKVKKFFEIGG
jgi:glutaredoxin-related protein